MRFIGSVIEKLQRHPKRVVFPEGTEPRVLQAARQFYSLRLGAPILLGDRTKVMEVEDGRFGENGVLLMGDCGVIPDPTVEQLADIAISTSQLARQLLGVRPRVALLSFSTKGSATHPSIGKVKAATALAQQHAH